MKICDV